MYILNRKNVFHEIKTISLKKKDTKLMLGTRQIGCHWKIYIPRGVYRVTSQQPVLFPQK